MVVTSGVSKLKRQGHLESAGGLARDEDRDEENLGGTEMKKTLVGQWSGARGLREASSPDSREGSLLRGGQAERATMAEQGNEG